uniref:Lipoprotein n=1 Tax=Candidatus Kentrum sp. DK TaxID=2126562 RepID=A0A450SRB5_9GAMM|nr:MAG: hypothetical protein BECKDK2373C_GA0170839_105412 [Candidatus Kentron sp. DK]
MTYKVILVVLGAALAGGCSWIADKYQADPIMAVQTDLLKPNEEAVDGKKLEKRIAAIGQDKGKRDELVNELLMLSDRVCSNHQAEIIANANDFNIVTGSITNLLSAAGTVVGGAATKAALAAGASVSGSTKTLVDNELYLESVGTTIVRAISVAREKYLAKIENGMQEEVKEYPVTEALRDVQEYHGRCSFYYGLMEISKALEQRKKTKAEIAGDIRALEDRKAKLTQGAALRATPADVRGLEERIDALLLEQLAAPAY